MALITTLLASLAAACGSTTDSLGDTRQPTQVLEPIKGPTTYPNLFKDVLLKSDKEISTKLDTAFDKLFHGDPLTESFYVADGEAAMILDSYHGDQRTEGYGLAMLIAVEMNKQDEFDRIWRGAQAFRYDVGPYEGYFWSVCDRPSGRELCVDPYGLQQFTMALLLANTRWKDSPSRVDYAKDASDLLYLLLHKEDMNGGVVDGVTNTFDEDTKLIPYQPNRAGVNITRPSLAMPAYYALWYQATTNPFFLEAAEKARDYLRAVSHPKTGLTPVRSDFDANPLPGFDTFYADCYRVQLNLMLDYVWSEQPVPSGDLSDRLLTFFTTQGPNYGRNFSLDGTVVLDTGHDAALVAANGMSAIAAPNNPQRLGFVQAVWSQPLPTGTPRYYAGLMQLLAMLALSGQLRADW